MPFGRGCSSGGAGGVLTDALVPLAGSGGESAEGPGGGPGCACSRSRRKMSVARRERSGSATSPSSLSWLSDTRAQRQYLGVRVPRETWPPGWRRVACAGTSRHSRSSWSGQEAISAQWDRSGRP